MIDNHDDKILNLIQNDDFMYFLYCLFLLQIVAYLTGIKSFTFSQAITIPSLLTL